MYRSAVGPDFTKQNGRTVSLFVREGAPSRANDVFWSVTELASFLHLDVPPEPSRPSAHWICTTRSAERMHPSGAGRRVIELSFCALPIISANERTV